MNPLHVCPECDSQMCQPIDWHERDRHHWWVLIRCPECWFERSGIVGQRIVEDFDNELDRASAALVTDLVRLTKSNMIDEGRILSVALAEDGIVADDFAMR